MKKSFLFFCFLLVLSQVIKGQTDLTFSEIMFAPESSTSEFIEIYNLSDSTIDLTGYQFKYYTAKNDEIISTGNGLKLASHSFAVIFENDYDINNGVYKNLVPTNALVLKISDNAFGSTGMSNSSNRAVVLLNKNGDTVNVYTYSADNEKGYSDEKIYLNEDNLAANWANSKSLNGTPGSQNSVTPVNYDLAITKFESEKDYEILGNNIQFETVVKNKGVVSSKDFQLNVFLDINKDSIAEDSEILKSFQGTSLQPGDSIIYQISTNNFSLGTNPFIAKVKTSEDENLTNNSAYYNVAGININEKRNDIVINEIMYAPESPQPEWIEIYNNSNKTINLEGYQISDNSDTILAITKSTICKPGEFIVISSDSTIKNFYNISSDVISAHIPTLNNSGDKVILLDSLDRVIDSLQYFPEWGGTNGYSLERISYDNSSTDSTNWRSSVSENKATPGMQNSVTPFNYDLTITRFESEKDYEILGNEIQFEAVVKNKGIVNSKGFQLNVFLDTNKDSIAEDSEIFNSFQGTSLQPGDSAVYQFSTNNFSPGKNLFIAKVETSEDESLTNNSAYYNVTGINLNETRNDIVINEIMYAPESPQPEWIEIYNSSSKTINLEGYKIADNSDTVSVVSEPTILNPDEFIVISSDSTIRNFYDINSNVISTHIPTLNNSGDKVILLDSLNRVIDSLQYSSEWGGIKGYSLERISYDKSSTDSTNWRSSLNENKATPGTKNSVADLISYQGTQIAVNEIMSDPGSSKCEFIELYNISDEKTNLGGWTIDDGSGNIIPVSNVNKNFDNKSFFLISADSSIINNYNLDDLTNVNILNSSLNLSTKEDIIILRDALGNMIDSVHYFEGWHNPNFLETQGKSLEKINPYLSGNDPDNWSTSADKKGATPGKQNSIYTISQNNESKVSVSPNPFSPDNDGFEDFTIIHYTLTQKIAQVKVKIFDSKGRLVRTLENNQASGSEGSIVFNGLDENNNPLRIGIYIALIEAINQNNGVTEKIKAAIVVAKKF